MHEFKINSLLWASLSVGRLSVYYWLSVSLGELFFTISQNWGHLSITRVATHQKVKNSVTFHWPLKSFHWSFINEKQSMLPFTLPFLGAINSFLFIFKLFLLCADRGRRNLQESIHNENHWSQLPHVSDVVSNWSLFLPCTILFVFSERKCISKSWRKVMNYKPENRIPWLFTDFDNIKDFPWLFKKFPDFSLTLKNVHFSLTFPWPWQPWLPASQIPRFWGVVSAVWILLYIKRY